MSKLTKLLKNPVKFVEDSTLFGFGNIEPIDNIDNIFVISTFAQLKNIESLIELEDLKNNLLIILYTKKNLKMPKNIEKNVNFKLFKEVRKLKLPNKPGNIDLNKIRYYIQTYYLMLNRIKAKSIYLFSFQGHYTILRNIAKSKDLKIILVEEGTASYKKVEQENNKDYFTRIHQKIITHIPFCANVYNKFEYVDVIYSAFPSLMNKNFKSAKTYTFLHPVFPNLKNKKFINNYGVSKNDIIFVNQKYNINQEEHVIAIMEILNELNSNSDSRVFIKLHPNDSDLIKHTFKKLINESSENFYLIENNIFLIEKLISEVKPKMLVGLTSTSLVYSPLISSTTKSVSIAREFIKRVKDNNNDGCEIIMDHFNILGQFDNVYEYFKGEFKVINNKIKDVNLYDNFLFYGLISCLDKFEFNVDEISFNENKVDKIAFNYLKDIFGTKSNFKELSFEDYINLNFSGLDIQSDCSLLSKYLIFKDNYRKNPFKSFYYLDLIIKEIDFIPESLVNEYLSLIFKNNLEDSYKENIVYCCENYSYIIDVENINSIVLYFMFKKEVDINFISKIDNNYGSLLFLYLNSLKFKMKPKVNLGFQDGNQLFLTYYFNILFNLIFNENTDINEIDINLVNCSEQKEIIKQGISLLNKPELHILRPMDINKNYSIFYLLLELAYLKRYNFKAFKSNIVKLEKENFRLDNIAFFALDACRGLNNFKAFESYFERAFERNYYINECNLKFYIDSCMDILKINKLLPYIHKLDNFMLYYSVIHKFICLYDLYRDENIFNFLQGFQNIEFNQQILDDGYLSFNIEELSVFKEFFTFKMLVV